jgi:hypothetical protein
MQRNNSLYESTNYHKKDAKKMNETIDLDTGEIFSEEQQPDDVEIYGESPTEDSGEYYESEYDENAPITMHKGQSDIIRWLFPESEITRAVRYAPVCASRGFGKSFVASVVAVMAVDYLLTLPKSRPNKNVSIVAPTHAQCLDIYFPILAHTLGMLDQCLKWDATHSTFHFRNGVKLKLWSYEASERMRGSGQFAIILDEVTSWEGRPGLKDSWESIMQPCMTTRWPGNHRALIITTPRGYDYFYEMYNMQDMDPERWKSFHYDFTMSPYLSAEEIERVKAQIDPIKFAREYKASFAESGANVFYMFSRKTHCDDTLPDFLPKEDVHVSIDFNVGIMAATMWAIRGNQMHALDEMMGHPDTESLAKTLKEKYIDKGHKVYAYPDPSGKARKTSATIGVTDFTILESHRIICRARSAHPPIVDSVQAVNRKLENANGQYDMFFKTSKVPNTIRSMERTKWVENNPNLATIDKKEGVEHFSDGVRYITEYLYPVTNKKSPVKMGTSF